MSIQRTYNPPAQIEEGISLVRFLQEQLEQLETYIQLAKENPDYSWTSFTKVLNITRLQESLQGGSQILPTLLFLSKFSIDSEELFKKENKVSKGNFHHLAFYPYVLFHPPLFLAKCRQCCQLFQLTEKLKEENSSFYNDFSFSVSRGLISLPTPL